MAVVGIAKEKIASREKRITKTEHWYRRVFLVQSDDAKDDPNVIETAFGLPKYGFHYITEKSMDLFALAISMSAVQISQTWWEVSVEYSNDSSKVETPGSPLFDPPTYQWGHVGVRRVVTGQSKWKETYDPSAQTQDEMTNGIVLWDSTGILNSAYEPYIPPAEIDVAIPTLTVGRNEPSFNHRYMLWYVNSVNKFKWYGWYKRTVKITSISGTLGTKTVGSKVYKYWKVQYTLAFNKETWDLFLLDIGSYYFDGGRNATLLRKVPHVPKGVPVPCLLTSDGDRSTSISRYNRYRVLSEIDFGRLMIPLVS